MTYWASNGVISDAVIPGGIEITEDQYMEALLGFAEGKVVSINGGFHVTDPVSAPVETPAPEPLDPLTVPLQRLDFWLAASEVGVSKWNVRDNIVALPEGVERNQAIAYFEDAIVYRRDDPLLISMAALEGIDGPQLDALWIWAVNIEDHPST